MAEAIETTAKPVGTRPTRTTLSLTRSQTRLAWLLLVPTLAVVAFIALYPLIQTFYNSLTNARLASGREAQFTGLDNYVNLVQDSDFLHSIWITVQFTLITIIFEF